MYQEVEFTIEDGMTEETVKQYKGDGFETEMIEEEGNYYVFTRRVVTEVVVEGQPI